MRMTRNKINYDFIEIGTSDFHTLIESASETTVGLSIEPLGFYLNNLPDKENVIKVNAAMSDEAGFVSIYYISQENMEKYNLPFWVRGCNSINSPHEYTRKFIGEELYDNIVSISEVPKISWEILVKEYGIGGINFLKIDTEGHDIIILKDYLRICQKHPELYADKILFENNGYATQEELNELLTQFDIYDYEILPEDVLLTKKGFFYKNKKVADQAFILNLPFRDDRRKKVDALLSSLGFRGYNFFDGEIIDNPDLEKFGCTLSQLNIFKKFLASNNTSMVLLEDDIKLLDGVSEKDLDLIFENWTETSETYDVIALGTKLLPRSKIELKGKTHGSFKELLCAQGFFYHRHVVEHIVEQLSNFDNPKHELYKCAIDMFLNDISNEKFRFRHFYELKTFNFGITIPMIFNQTNGYSDNEKKNENYENLIENSYWNALPIPKTEVLANRGKKSKGFVYYCNEKYIDIVDQSIKILRKYSNLPVYVYLINCEHNFEIENVTSVNWSVDLETFDNQMYQNNEDNFYIVRHDKRFYNLLIQRPLIVKHCLENFLETLIYLDSDTVVMPWVENIFNHYDVNCEHPFFTECFYDYLSYNNVGHAADGDNFNNTLESKACQIFNVDQSVRTWYRQTGYFIASQKTIEFLEEWYWMCNHPKILKNPAEYAAYHEETIMNVLLWKHKIFSGLHIVYVNSTLENIDRIFSHEFNGQVQMLAPWFAVPGELKHIYFLHGEKNPNKMNEMSKIIDIQTQKINF